MMTLVIRITVHSVDRAERIVRQHMKMLHPAYH